MFWRYSTKEEQELKAQHVIFKLSEWKRFFGLLIVPHIPMRRIFVLTCGMQPSGCRFSSCVPFVSCLFPTSFFNRYYCPEKVL